MNNKSWKDHHKLFEEKAGSIGNDVCENEINEASNTNNKGLESCESSSNESDLSLYMMDNDLDECMNSTHTDELPAFDLRSISPHGRTPSPITTTSEEKGENPASIHKFTERTTCFISNSCHDNPDYVALHDINAQISLPNERQTQYVRAAHLHRRHNNPYSSNFHSLYSSNEVIHNTSNLETIFEGVFLHTPPKNKSIVNNNSNRSNKRNIGVDIMNCNNNLQQQSHDAIIKQMILDDSQLSNQKSKQNKSPVDSDNDKIPNNQHQGPS